MKGKPKLPTALTHNQKKEERQRQISIEIFDSAIASATEPTKKIDCRPDITASSSLQKQQSTQPLPRAAIAAAALETADAPSEKSETQKRNEADALSQRSQKSSTQESSPWEKLNSPLGATPLGALPLEPTKSASSPPFSNSLASSSNVAPAHYNLWLAVHCPHLAIEVTPNAHIDRPAIVVDEHERHPRIVAVNRKANEAGLTHGLLLSVAHTLAKDITVTVHNPTAIIARLHHLAEYAGRFTSAVSVEPPDMLLLEVLGSLKLFGNFQQLKHRIIHAFEQQGHTVKCSTSPFPCAAILMARAGIYADAMDQSKNLSRVRSIAIHHLELTDKQHRTLSGMGLRTVDDLIRLPRDGLARRITPALLNHLDRLRGLAADPKHLYRAAKYFHREHHFDEPVSDVRLLLIIANKLIDALVQELRLGNTGVHELHWTLTHTDHPDTNTQLILTHAVRHADHLQHLVKERFERLELIDSVDTLMLTTSRFEAASQTSLNLFNHLPTQDSPAAFALIDRLRSRLGEQSVYGFETIAEHRPEHAFRICKPDRLFGRSIKSTTTDRQNRPIWLLHKPFKLHVIDGRPYFKGLLTLLDSQERIESGWWDQSPIQRDYYLALNRHGEQLWIYQDLQDKENHSWYLHGLFS